MHREGLKALWSHYTGLAHELPMAEILARWLQVRSTTRWWQVGATHKVLAGWVQGGGRLVPPRWWQVGAATHRRHRLPATGVQQQRRACLAQCAHLLHWACWTCPPSWLPLGGTHQPFPGFPTWSCSCSWCTTSLCTSSPSHLQPLKVSPTHTQGAQRRKASQPLQWPSPPAGGTTRATRQIRESDLQTTNHQTQRPQTWPAHQLVKEREGLHILNPNKESTGLDRKEITLDIEPQTVTSESSNVTTSIGSIFSIICETVKLRYQFGPLIQAEL